MLSFLSEDLKNSHFKKEKLVGLCWGLWRENQHVRVPVSNIQRWGCHSRPNPVYHKGRPEHWHWTLSHLKEGRGTAQGLSSNTNGEDPGWCHGRISSTTAHRRLIHNAVMWKKHATESLSETKAQSSQPPDDAEVAFTERQPALRRSAQMCLFTDLFFTCFKKLWPPF